jgi:hypothetical protein
MNELEKYVHDLRAALEPFAKDASTYEGIVLTEVTNPFHRLVANLRVAKAVYEVTPPDDEFNDVDYERERCADICAEVAASADAGEVYIAMKIREKIMNPSDVAGPIASDDAEAGISDDGTESGSSKAALRPSWEKIHQPFSAPLGLGIPKSDWLYPVWDRESAICLMRQADEVVGEVYQSLRNDSWGDIKWHCKTSDERGLEKTHTLAEAKCEASFWKYEWMKATGRAPE